eukprot:7388921-Prymnesium_polylepis.2
MVLTDRVRLAFVRGLQEQAVSRFTVNGGIAIAHRAGTERFEAALLRCAEHSELHRTVCPPLPICSAIARSRSLPSLRGGRGRHTILAPGAPACCRAAPQRRNGATHAARCGPERARPSLAAVVASQPAPFAPSPGARRWQRPRLPPRPHGRRPLAAQRAR